MSLRALELYCGIGGFAEAVEGRGIKVVAALDASQHVVQTYNLNHTPVARQRNLLQMKTHHFAEYEADLWWMSPPCAPYTRRGNQLDLDDHRTVSYLLVVDAIRELRPRYVAMENVEGFADSAARDALLGALQGYEVVDHVLCPTNLGVPNKRPRFYLVADRDGTEGVRRAESPQSSLSNWRSYLQSDVVPDVVPEEIVERYGKGFHVMTDGEPYTTCFTGSYGKSWNYTGSYLPLDESRLRRFSPREVLNFLGFAPSFRFPDEFDARQRYKYAGNSLSVPAVRHVLSNLISQS